jgi:UDP-hydrolysing UDP-N-acetyl-D-glucosamine 2-epimerase
MPKVLSVSSSRADVGALAPVWRALSSRNEIDLHIFATGMHAESSQDLPIPDRATFHRGGADIGGRKDGSAARSMAACAIAASEVMDRNDFDCILVMGDRLDMFPAAFAALPYNVPLAHIHGGELTLGAIDDRSRHALTKMSHLHFVSGVEAATRLARMGEEPWRIQITGAPGLEALIEAPVLSRAEFESRLELPFKGDFVLVTVHPETNSQAPDAPMRAVLAAVETIDAQLLITAPNSDPGGMNLRAMLETWLAGRPHVAFRDTLGAALYANALRHAVAMVGNSSSGLIEAGIFGLPVINVGDRQKGRAAGVNVRHVPSDPREIVEVLKGVLATRNRFPEGSPYGDGHSAARIAATLAQLPDRATLLCKLFYEGSIPDFQVPWNEPRSSKKIWSAR